MAAGQVADGIAGQEKEHSGFTGCIAHPVQCVLLVGRQPVIQKVDVIGHSASCFRRLQPWPSA